MKNKHYIGDYVYTLHNNKVLKSKIIGIKEGEYELQYLGETFFKNENAVFKTELKCKNKIIRNLYETYSLKRDTLMQNGYLLSK